MMKGPYCPESDKLSIAVVGDEKAKASDCHGSNLMSLAAGSFGIMDGLTEFVPWTGFDYSSDCDGDDDEIEDTLPVSGAAKKKRKRANQKQPSADADIIATATEENLRKLGIDPNSNEGKKQRRKIRNRLSAQLHRERKKGYISYLEGLVRERDAKLLSVSADYSRLNMEVEKLRKVAVTNRNVDDNVGYSSGAGHTDSDAGDDSDTVSISSEVNGANLSPPMTPIKGFTMGTRFKGSKIGSAFSLFSAVLMISITIFGPHFQSVNQVLLDSDSAPRDASVSSTLSIGDSEGYNLKIPDTHSLELDAHSKQLIPSIHRSLLASVTPPPPPNLTDLPVESEESKHFSEDVAKSLIHSSRVRFNSQSVISSNSQALWHFHDHVTDLYPSYLPYYSPDLDPSRNQTPSCHKVRVTSRKNLRAREDSNGTYPVISGREELQSGQLQRRYDARRLKSSHETEDTDTRDMGKTLVSVVPGSSLKQSPAASSTSSSTTTRLTGQPAIDYNTDSTSTSSAKYSSVSRVLLTQGRALLDPSLVIPLEVDKSKNNVVPTNKGKSATDTFLKTLSTWTGTGGRAADDPPVVRVGINTMGSSPVDPSSSNNMLVLLLPASAVRWGKNWQESSDGTMDAMLKGLNFSEGAYGKMDDGEPDGAVEEGMWVEIGCSVIKAQLVRNVTLSS
jgi:bZIP transcription factor